MHASDFRTTFQAAFSSQLIDSSRDSFVYHLFPGRFPTYEDLSSLAFELYDRIPRPVKPISIRGLPMTSSVTSTQSPHFTIVNEDRRTPELTLAWPLRSYDITNRWKMVHCAYAHDIELSMTAALVMDGEGQTWHVTTWSGVQGADRLRDVWAWFHEMAESAGVEYRLAICCPTTVGVAELDGELDSISRLTAASLERSHQEEASPDHARVYAGSTIQLRDSDPTQTHSHRSTRSSRRSNFKGNRRIALCQLCVVQSSLATRNGVDCRRCTR